MKLALTLEQFIQSNEAPGASGIFSSIMSDLGLSCRMTAALLRKGNFTGDLSKGASTNSSGDQQAPLDIQANNIFLNILKNNGSVAALVSEELEEIHYFEGSEDQKYIVILDPLDGSGNLDINAPVSSIFSIVRNPSNTKPTTEEVLKAGKDPVAAGICLYGLATTFAFCTGDGVHGFSQDLESGAFFYTHPYMKISDEAKEVAINFSNKNYWNKAITRYVDECFLGKEGPRQKYFNTRWYASAAAELNRILVRGGVFIYPACSNGKPQGVLRKLYEAWPMAYLVEAAGGKATDGKTRVLDLEASDLHERTPFAMGSSSEIDLLEKYHKNQ
ncbi:MAG: fructose-bisphosphatase class I [Halobacteriovorax sp.]|nr:fructose-bisphosphatase class I [Halobacteriovorax sp.]